MGQAEGWYSDPFFRGQERYWNGRVWTQGIREAEGSGAGAKKTRPAPLAAEASGTANLTATLTATLASALTSTQSTDSTDSTDSTEAGPAGPADEADARLAAAFARAGKVPHADAPPAEDPAVDQDEEPDEEPHLSFAPLGAPVRPGGLMVVPKKKEKRKRGRRARHGAAGIVGTALVLVVGAAGAMFLLVGSGPAAAQVALANAAMQTMNSQSADMSLSMNMSVMGFNENVSANGAFDFAQKTGTMTMTIPVNGQQYSEQEIVDGSTIYVNLGGLTGGLLPGKPWVSEPVDQANNSGNGLNALDPTAMLEQLQTGGGTVTSLGLTTYDGTSVTEYQATLPSSALMGDIGKLPSSVQQGVSGLNLPDMQIDVYVTQDNLLKALVLAPYSVSFSGQTMTMDMTLVLSNYGTPVTVTPPPADETEPLSQFGGGLGNSGTTGNSGLAGSTGTSI